MKINLATTCSVISNSSASTNVTGVAFYRHVPPYVVYHTDDDRSCEYSIMCILYVPMISGVSRGYFPREADHVWGVSNMKRIAG